MAKAKGPGPMNPLAAAIKAGIKKKAEERMSNIAKSQGPADGRVVRSDKKVGTQDYLNEGQMLEMSGKVRTRAKDSSPESRTAAIKEGLFVEKNGDLFPTAKYEEYKKSGKLGKFVK
jgi:hypothetical protein